MLKNNVYNKLNWCYHRQFNTQTDKFENIDDLIKNDLKNIHSEIKRKLSTKHFELQNLSHYYFDGSGKSLRPLIICTMSRVINLHYKHENVKQLEQIMNNQRQIALIAEMIHVASLIHDDIIDNSDFRRGKASINSKWGCTKAVFGGDYILAVAARDIAKIGNTKVVETLSKVLEDLVQGELMQLGAKECDNERFAHYLTKTYRKTASLIANSCKAVAILNTNKENDDFINISFEYGKNAGIAFQLIDDLLDFTASGEKLGKPCLGNDLKLGLATAPVLFAASEFPQLNTMIMRRFSENGDAIKAFNLVLKSNGIEQTKQLALKYCENALKILKKFGNNETINYLNFLTNTIVNREK